MQLANFLTLLPTFALLSSAWPTVHGRSKIVARADEPPTLNGIATDYEKLSPGDTDWLLSHLTRKELEKLHDCAAPEATCAGHLPDLARRAGELGLLAPFDNSR
ncbi:hypothetical protein BDV26DRAFT_294790 [Aspergillus bertholletiae]|uniref:Uncharacterized protein n=1 Tax=Aspergillus bertholletiae TaxID=1226010 RepID=A0A5N7B0Y4_9EURO|nr:hypothetical protein BDV26DRAFT_294790 [Aspergillus bertholletiae]